MSVARRSIVSQSSISMPFSRSVQATSWISSAACEDVRGRLLGRLDDVIELLGRADELPVELDRRLDLRDLAAGARDRLAHLDQLGQHVARRRLPLRLEHRRLELPDCLEQHVGLCGAVAAGIFGQEPAATGRGGKRRLERGIILGKRSLWRLRWRCAGALSGAFRHGGEANVIWGRGGV